MTIEPAQATINEDMPTVAVDEAAALTEAATPREPLPAPEHKDVLASAVVHAPGQHRVSNVESNTPEELKKEFAHIPVLAPKTFKQAEKNLAHYIGNIITPQLTLQYDDIESPLILTMSNELGGIDGFSHLKLCFKSSLIESNYALYQEEITKALCSSKVLAPHIIPSHPIDRPQKHSLRFERAVDEQGKTMMHVYIPGVEYKEYANIITALAQPEKVLAPAVQKEEVMADAAITAGPEAILPQEPKVPAAPVAKDEAVIADAPIPEAALIDQAAPAQAPIAKIEQPVHHDGIAQQQAAGIAV